MKKDDNAAVDTKIEDAPAAEADAKPEPAKKKSLIEAAPVVEEVIELTDNDIIDDEEWEHEPCFEHVERVHFHAMVDVLHSLSAAFMPEKDDQPNDRFIAAWHCALALGCWSEDDFWESYELEDACPICGMDMGEEEEEALPELPVKDAKKLAN